MHKDSDRDGFEPRCFVQVMQRPSVGVEVSSGRAWVGVDQQVGHGSADSLFALTEEQYTAAIADASISADLVHEYWRGEHDELRLFDPRRGGFRPTHWFPHRGRMPPPKFAGELWWHIDAIGAPMDDERVGISRRLAAGTGLVLGDAEGVRGMAFRLAGDGAYPRPAALIGGLRAGSDRERARAVLGPPVDASGTVFAIEGMRARLGFVNGGLTEIALEEAARQPLPGGQIGIFLSALGEPEEAPRFRAAAQLSGARNQRWMGSSGAGRRLLVFANGVEMQVEDDRVLSVRIGLSPGTTEPIYRHAGELVPGATWPLSRAALHQALGAPADSNGGTDLYRFGQRDLLISYELRSGDERPIEITAVLAGFTVSHALNRWRSGTVTLFLDLLGRDASNPLVVHAQGLRGVQLRMRANVVVAVEMNDRSIGFEAFVDGLPANPRRNEIPFGAPTEYGMHDDLWAFEQGWVHVRSSWNGKIAKISVSLEEELPKGLRVRPWRFERDTMEKWRQLSSP